MAKKKRKSGKVQKTREQSSGGHSVPLGRRKVPNWPILIPALVGVALTGYLTYGSMTQSPLPFCGEDSSCDIVQESRWGTFLGLPTSFWGLAGFVALAWMGLRLRNALWHWRMTSFLALMGLGVSVYLTAVSVQILEATCIYCLTSLGLWTLIFMIAAGQRPREWIDFSWPSFVAQGAVLVIVVVGGLHLHFSGIFDPTMGEEDPYTKSLSVHLTDSGAIFYGAFW